MRKSHCGYKISSNSTIGIDVKGRAKSNQTKRTTLKSEDVYLNVPMKLYRFLVRRTESKFSVVVLTYMFMSKTNSSPLSLSRLIAFMSRKKDKITMLVCSITDDVIVYEVPTMKVCAMRFTEIARVRIEKSGGECLTFYQFALRAPFGQNTILIRGLNNACKVGKNFGPTLSVPDSHTKPYMRSKGKMFEKARGTRNIRRYMD